jgi:hypothetical protein
MAGAASSDVDPQKRQRVNVASIVSRRSGLVGAPEDLFKSYMRNMGPPPLPEAMVAVSTYRGIVPVS